MQEKEKECIEHIFNVHVAKVVGLNAAVVFKNIHFWWKQNKDNDRNLKDEKYWTFQSRSDIGKRLPYLTDSMIRGAIKKLNSHGLILIGEYNKKAYDKTSWYSITDKAIELLTIGEFNQCIGNNNQSNVLKSPIDESELTNRLVEINQPIPDTNQDTKTDKEVFEVFRLAYSGNKRGLDTEFAHFKKKHKDWKNNLDKLLPAIEAEKKDRQQKKRLDQFIPPMKHLKNWIFERCWEVEFEETKSTELHKIPKGPTMPY